MRIECVRRWQWFLLSVAVGAALWWSWRSDGGDLSRYGECLSDPAAFENGLADTLDGVPRLRDLRVHRQALDDGSGASRTVYVATGNYCDGMPDPVDGTYRWRPRYFIAPVPYRARTNVYQFGRGSDAAVKAARAYDRMAAPTLLDFLGLVEETNGVPFTYAWWRTYPAVTWVGASVLLIGVVWPTVINLLVFGRLARPREEKGIDLRGVMGSGATAAQCGPSDGDLEHLHQLEAELEAKPAGGADDARPTNAPQAPPPVRTLTTAPLEPLPADAHDTVFGAKSDDFYPTERRGSAAHPPAE